MAAKQTIFFDETPAPPLKSVSRKSRMAPKSQRGSTKTVKRSLKAADNGPQPPAVVNKARALLLQRCADKQKESAAAPEGIGEDGLDGLEWSSGAGGGGSIRDIVSEADDIDTVKKASVFKSELTEQEQDIIKKRVAQQQRQYEEFRRREINKKFVKIRLVHPHVTEKEVEIALDDCNDDETEVVEKLTDPGFLHSLRKRIAFEKEGREPPPEKNEDEEGTGDFVKPRKKRMYGGESDDEDESGEKRAKRKRRRKNAANGGEQASGDGQANGEDEDGNENGGIPRAPGRTKKGARRISKLKLDDALAKQKNGQFEGWSEARIRAFKLIDQNPNAYYYRFNAPGEPQRNGGWSKEEKELFFKRVAEIGVNRQWGIFSMVISGRVGYQCSNFYRHLIEKGKVKDENYEIDANGKAHFKFKKGPRQASATPGVAAPVAERKQPARKRKRNDETMGTEEDGEYIPPAATRRKAEKEEQEGDQDKSKDNPLPGFIDPITLDEVEQPAISPYGHVMSYSSWSRCLTGNNVCPLTKKPLKKRDLILLTWDNIDQYIDNIVNWN